MAKLIEIRVLEGIAVSMFAFAYAIGVRRKVHLIAGYNEKSAEHVRDKPALARLVARLCVLVGAASAIMPVATYIWPSPQPAFDGVTGAYVGLIVGAAIMTILEAREFTSRDRQPPGTAAT